MTAADRQSAKPRGRPRSEDSRRAIIDAAWELMRDHPVPAVTIEGVAKRAGVGKTTIYRWWPTRPALLCDAFLEAIDANLEFKASASFAQTLRDQFTTLARLVAGDVGRIVRELLAETAIDPKAQQLFADRFIQPRRDAARRIIEEGIAAGEFRADLDPAYAMDVFYGPIYFRLLVSCDPLDQAFIEQLPHTALRGLLA